MTNFREVYEYRNDFMYFVIRPDAERGEGTLLYCSGVDLLRFLPITKGRHGVCSNSAMRGLQLVNLGVRELALERGVTPKAVKVNLCAGLAPKTGHWYTDLLLIENAGESFPDEVIQYCVINLLKKIVKATLLDIKTPDIMLKPDELQVFIEGMCVQFGAKS